MCAVCVRPIERRAHDLLDAVDTSEQETVNVYTDTHKHTRDYETRMNVYTTHTYMAIC